jgi:hypothetical protein
VLASSTTKAYRKVGFTLPFEGGYKKEVKKKEKQKIKEKNRKKTYKAKRKILEEE